jgi:hypothetical protein
MTVDSLAERSYAHATRNERTFRREPLPPLLLIVLVLSLRALYVWLQPWCWALAMCWNEKRLHDDEQFVEFFYGPAGLNMMALMREREDGMQWVYDPLGLPVAPPVVKRAASPCAS